MTQIGQMYEKEKIEYGNQKGVGLCPFLLSRKTSKKMKQ